MSSRAFSSSKSSAERPWESDEYATGETPLTLDEIENEWRNCPTRELKRLLWDRLAFDGGWIAACRQAVILGDAEAVESWLAPRNVRKRAIVDFHGREYALRLDLHLRCARRLIDEACADDALALDERPSEPNPGRRAPDASAAHLAPDAFARDLMDAIAGRPPREAVVERQALFPLVYRGGDRDGEAILAQFSFEALSGGRGEVFLAANQAFLRMDDEFRAMFDQAPRILAERGIAQRCGDVRVRVDYFDRKTTVDLPLEGSSGGGAFALGLWSAWTGAPLETGLVTSFALTPPGVDAPDGRCHPIDAGFEKARRVANEKGGGGIFLVAAGQSPAVDTQGKQMGLRIARVETLQAAVEVASGRIRELDRYLRSLIDRLEITPWRRRGRVVPASAVAAPVRVLKEEVTPAALRPRHAKLDGSPPRRKPDPARDPEVSARHAGSERRPEEQCRAWETERKQIRRAVILGGPGSGKSFLIRGTAVRLARDALGELHARQPSREAAPIPVHLDLGGLARHDLPSDPVEALLELLRLEYGLSSRLTEWIGERLPGEGCWLLLDALDEIPEAGRGRVADLFERIERAGWRCRILVTCRAAHFDDRLLGSWLTVTKYELAPFRPSEVRAFLDRWWESDREECASLRRLLDLNPALMQACGSPLISTLACLAHEESPLSGEMRRGDLYARVLRGLTRRAWKGDPVERSDPRVDDLLTLAESAAWELFHLRAEMNLFSNRELVHALHSARRRAAARGFPTPEPADIRDEWLRCGLLVHGGMSPRQEAQFSFLHRSVLEYLTACELRHLLEDPPFYSREDPWAEVDWGFVDRIAWRPEWREVVTLLAGRLDSAEPLLKRLADPRPTLTNPHGDDLFRHRLSLAVRCLGEISPRMGGALSGWIDRMTTDVVHLCWDHRSKGTDETVAVLSDALPVLARWNGSVSGVPLSEWLEQALVSGDGVTRGHAVWLAGRLGKGITRPGVVTALLDRILYDEERAVRQKAESALYEIDGAVMPPEIPSFLMSLMKHAEKPEVRWQAAWIMRTILRTAPSAGARSELVDRALNGVEDEQRCLAAMALGESSPPEVVSFALNRVLDPEIEDDADRRSGTFNGLSGWLLGVMGGAAASPEVMNPLVDGLAWSESARVRIRAAGSLAEIGEKAAMTEVLGALVERFLHDEARDVRWMAGWALAKIGRDGLTPDQVSALADCFFQEQDGELRDAAAEVLAGLGRAAASPDLVSGLTECIAGRTAPDLASWILGAMGEAAASPAAARALAGYLPQAEGAGGHFLVAWALTEMGSVAVTPEVVSSLTETVRPGEDRSARIHAAWALSRMRLEVVSPETVLLWLERSPADEPCSHRVRLVETVGDLAEAAATPELVSALINATFNDPNPDVRRAGAAALSKLMGTGLRFFAPDLPGPAATNR